MKPRFRIETEIEDAHINIDLHWNDAGLLTRVQLVEWREDEEIELMPEPPYGVASLARELKCFFRAGEPLLPFHWSLADTLSISEFARKVYEAVLQILHGETRTYSWVAARVGKPAAARAVGQALKRNPFPICVPCHRVVADKSIGGFMGCTEPEDWELKFKNRLLDLERSYRNPCFSFVESTFSMCPFHA